MREEGREEGREEDEGVTHPKAPHRKAHTLSVRLYFAAFPNFVVSLW